MNNNKRKQNRDQVTRNRHVPTFRFSNNIFANKSAGTILNGYVDMGNVLDQHKQMVFLGLSVHMV